MNLLGTLIVALQAAATPPPAASQQTSPPPVVVVDDPREARRAIGFRVDDIFTPSQEEAETPRRDLGRYIEAERRREKNDDRQSRLRRIGLAADRYFWHCAGYAKDGDKYLFCSFVRYDPSQLSQLRRKTFPAIHDGGISVCRCHFNMKLGRIVRLEWNGEA